jgi:iron(III) transport system permease protein
MDQDKREHLAGRPRNGRKEFSMILRQPVLAFTIFIIMGTLILFVLYPMAGIVRMSFTGEAGQPSLRAMIRVLTSRSYQITFRNSILLALGTSILSTITGYIFAFAITRTEMPGKRFFRTLVQLPIISPPFILALSIIFLFGRQGIITRNIFGITDTNVYGGGSLLAIQVISFFPTAFLTLTGILSSIDTSVEDAALNMGAGRWHIFRTVTFPLSLPGVISAVLLTFVQSLEDFSNPAVIGGNFSTLAVETYHTITGLYDLHGGSALALVLLLPTVCAFMLQRHWLGKRSFVTVTGKPAQVTRKLHGTILPVLFFFCGTVSLIIILLYGTVAVGAFARTWGNQLFPRVVPPEIRLDLRKERHRQFPYPVGHIRTHHGPFGYYHCLSYDPAALSRPPGNAGVFPADLCHPRYCSGFKLYLRV